MFGKNKRIATLEAQLAACEASLDATQRQLEIRIAENLPGGRYFNGGMPAVLVGPPPRVYVTCTTAPAPETEWWLTNNE